MKFKETKSQERLINLMLQAGVEWPDRAEFAAQDKKYMKVYFYNEKPYRDFGYDKWDCISYLGVIGVSVKLPELCLNWHQTIITREQYKARDGWITWHGGECPVDGDLFVETMWSDGDHLIDPVRIFGWNHDEDEPNITHYRTHKPAEQAADDELHALPVEPCEPIEVGSKCISKLHVDVVAVSVINDIEKKTAEAEKHKAEFERCQGELAEMRKALDDMLAVVGLKAVEVERGGERHEKYKYYDDNGGHFLDLSPMSLNGVLHENTLDTPRQIHSIIENIEECYEIINYYQAELVAHTEGRDKFFFELNERLSRVEIEVVKAEQEVKQPTITDWRDLRVGDVIECVPYGDERDDDWPGGWASGTVGTTNALLRIEDGGRLIIDSNDRLNPSNGRDSGYAFKFIRRP